MPHRKKMPVASKRTDKKTIGSSFDNFLKEEGGYKMAQGVAIKRVLTYQIRKAVKKAFKKEGITQKRGNRPRRTSTDLGVTQEGSAS
jgi:hypothetical protein